MSPPNRQLFRSTISLTNAAAPQEYPHNKLAEMLIAISHKQLSLCLLGTLQSPHYTNPVFMQTQQSKDTKNGSISFEICYILLKSERTCQRSSKIRWIWDEQTEVGIRGSLWGWPPVSTTEAAHSLFTMILLGNLLCRKFQSLIIALITRFYCMFLKA